jgi:WD40 repeat protein
MPRETRATARRRYRKPIYPSTKDVMPGPFLAAGNVGPKDKVVVHIPGQASLDSHSGPLRCVAFSPGGAAFATGGDDKAIRLRDAASKQRAIRFTGTWAGRAICFSPDGTTLASVGDETGICAELGVWCNAGVMTSVHGVAW